MSKPLDVASAQRKSAEGEIRRRDHLLAEKSLGTW